MPITKSQMQGYYKRSSVQDVFKDRFVVHYVCDSMQAAEDFIKQMEDAMGQIPNFQLGANWHYNRAYFVVEATFSPKSTPTALGTLIRQTGASEWKGLTSSLERAGIIPYVLKTEIDRRVDSLHPSILVNRRP